MTNPAANETWLFPGSSDDRGAYGTIQLDGDRGVFNPPYEFLTPNQPGNDSMILQFNQTLLNDSHRGPSSENLGSDAADSFAAVTAISILFCIIGLFGIVGNTMVIFIVVLDRKMRRSVTNLFIVNLALSDLFIMLCGVPETVQFMINKGWLLGESMCKMNRYVLVVCLYSSVVTLVCVCVERYIAIVHPMRAHLLCSRRRMLVVIAATWPAVCLLGLPVAIFNREIESRTIRFCSLQFPHHSYLVMFKYLEFILFYLVPMIIQIACYSVLGKHLFAGAEELHRIQTPVRGAADGSGTRERHSEAMKARKGVVKMLIASVIIYFVSYSPHQVLLFYNTFSPAPYKQTWVFIGLVTAMGYINSAANPVLYCIFSQKFRVKFRSIFKCGAAADAQKDATRIPLQYASQTDSGVDMRSFRRSTKRSVLTLDERTLLRDHCSCTPPTNRSKETFV